MGTSTSPRDSACAQCGRPIYAGTPYVQPFGESTHLCGQKCLKEWEGDRKSEQVDFKNTLTGKTVSSVGKLASSGWKSFSKSLDEDKERNENEKFQIEAKAAQISKFSYSENINDLKNEIEELIILRKGLKAEELPVKKAIYEKLQFGIERLRQEGENIDFFNTKVEKLKPSLWEKITYFSAMN